MYGVVLYSVSGSGGVGLEECRPDYKACGERWGMADL